ncbi:MAG: glucosidase, partial [Acidobacteria bacterium]
MTPDLESVRLEEDERRTKNWKRWGPYLAERQWGTVREDYSADGSCWTYLPHDHARSRAYRWGEDGLLGVCDREGRLCFALALWNGRDPILKERLFGLTNYEGNHGEDVKEQYFYLDSTPTHSYMKALYKYPQGEFPYARLVEENRRRGVDETEFEILDTGVFDGDAYFDVLAEYAKASPDDLLIQVTVANRSAQEARIEVLPTLWFCNTWSWGRSGEGYWPKPRLSRANGAILADHVSLGRFRLLVGPDPGGEPPTLVFTENETNAARLFGTPNSSPWVKDAFHELVVHGREDAVNPQAEGTKSAARYRLSLPAGGEAVLRLRLHSEDEAPGEEPLGAGFDEVIAARRREADAFYAARTPAAAGPEETRVTRQALAGLLWSEQFYHYVVKHWLEGDPAQPPPPAERGHGRNSDWMHVYNRDVLSVPDKWEYPWYASWDL